MRYLIFVFEIKSCYLLIFINDFYQIGILAKTCASIFQTIKNDKI